MEAAEAASNGESWNRGALGARLETVVLQVDPQSITSGSQSADAATANAAIDTCATILKTTALPVAFPTETVYGLGANALSENCVASIFRAKGRPSDNPLIVHVSSLDMARSLLPQQHPPPPRSVESTESSSSSPPLPQDPVPEIPAQYLPLLAKFWPGPLTILLPRGAQVPSTVTAGHPSVAVRMPGHPVALALIEKCGFPIAAPSANTSGRPSPTRASHVKDDLDGVVPYILDGGDCAGGVESTVLDGLSRPPVILRPGGVTLEMIRKFPGFEDVRVFKKDFSDDAMEQAPVTPGMKYRHYSPRMEVVLFERGDLNDDEEERRVVARMGAEAAAVLERHKRDRGPSEGEAVVGVLRTSCRHHVEIPSAALGAATRWRIVEHQLGNGEQTAAAVARGLFHGLRLLESKGVVVIFVEGTAEEHEGLAVMNRVRKAATRVVPL